MLGTATDAIAKLDVSPKLIKEMETNVAVGYAVCYIFGSLGPIILVTWFFPMVMKWDVRAEALKLAKEMSGGKEELEPGQFNAVRAVVTRLYRVAPDAMAVGKTAAEVDREFPDLAVEAAIRDGVTLEANDDTTIQAGDVVAMTGKVAALEEAAAALGPETVAPDGFQLVEENRDIILTNRELVHQPLRAVGERIEPDARRGTFLVAIKRMGRDLPILPELKLRRGDELTFTGRPKALDRLQAKIGYEITPAAITDFIFFGIGMTLGIFIGMIDFKIAGIPVTIGTGGGCLLSGLLFGWLRSVHPHFAALPTGASNFLRDFGLAVFVGVIGVTAGPAALVTIENQGLTLFLLGVGVTIIPTVITFYISYYLLNIRNPIEALACLVGGRSANPGFAALLDKAGNATPVVSFTVTYAVANVLLTLWGPLIVGIITKNPPS
jgi:aspartate-alanine antiporter